MKQSILVALIAMVSVTAAAQDNSNSSSGSDPYPSSDNSCHLLYTVPGFDTQGHFITYTKEHGDQSPGNPQEENGVYVDNTNKIVLMNPPGECTNTGPSQTNACTFAEESGTQEDDHHIRYHFKNWGGRCDLSLRIMVYPPVSTPHWSDTTPWSVGSPFVVVVPEAANSATVFGRLNGGTIFFTPSDNLSAADAQHFTFLDKKVISGFGTIYRFSVK